jgi:hypothetical protein
MKRETKIGTFRDVLEKTHEKKFFCGKYSKIKEKT